MKILYFVEDIKKANKNLPHEHYINRWFLKYRSGTNKPPSPTYHKFSGIVTLSIIKVKLTRGLTGKYLTPE
jgi:hypothetical protein